MVLPNQKLNSLSTVIEQFETLAKINCTFFRELIAIAGTIFCSDVFCDFVAKYCNNCPFSRCKNCSDTNAQLFAIFMF